MDASTHASSEPEIVLPCENIASNLRFFTAMVGFRLVSIFPADEPSEAVIEGFGLRLRLAESDSDQAPPLRIRLNEGDIEQNLAEVLPATAPNGVIIEAPKPFKPLDESRKEPVFIHTKLSGDSGWKTGRAGMLYRDLIPGRLGGRLIASHIRIPEGGPVPDYVHFHRVLFQTIFCLRGNARLVYEEQGDPFIFEAGDCVLQPPEIRHRVLACSDGFEVVELTSPAEHETFAEHEISLPTAGIGPERDFGGQRFLRHIAAKSDYLNSPVPGFESAETGIGVASGGIGGLRLLRPRAKATPLIEHHAEVMFLFVLVGTALLLAGDREPATIDAFDALVIPAGMPFGFSGCSENLHLLSITLPAEAKFETPG